MTLRLGLMASVAGAALFVAGCGDEQCTTDTDCAANEFCEQVSKQCLPDDSSQTDNCTKPGECTAPQVCDVAAGACVSAATCTATDTTQPDTACAYGLWCSSGTCAEVPLATSACSNYGTGGHALSWPPATATDRGPIIFKIEALAGVRNSTACTSSAPHQYKYKVYAYDPQAGFPAATSSRTDEAAVEAKLHLVRPDGSEASSTDTVFAYAQSNGGGTAQFEVRVCRNDTAAYSAGTHFQGGNEVCVSLAAIP